MKTIKVLAIFNNIDWTSILEKLNRLKEKAAPFINLEFTVLHTSLNDILFTANSSTTKEVDQNWIKNVIAPLIKDQYDIGLLTINNAQWQGGEENGTTYMQLPVVSVVHADEDEILFGNPIYDGWYERTQHEVLGHAFSELTGRVPDDSHEVEKTHRLDSPEALSRYDWSKYTPVADRDTNLIYQLQNQIEDVTLNLGDIAHDINDLVRLLHAQIMVESGGNDNAIGDTNLAQKAYGPLQIRQPACDDVNAKLGTHYKAENMLGNRPDSIKVWSGYLNIWCSKERLGRECTIEDMARCWNAGPNWMANLPSTDAYWNAVKKYL